MQSLLLKSCCQISPLCSTLSSFLHFTTDRLLCASQFFCLAFIEHCSIVTTLLYCIPHILPPHHFILYPLYQPFLNTLANSGHIPQNARLAIRALDVAMPYVCFQKTVISNQLSTSKSIPEARFDFKWHVGGAITVDATWLVVHNPPSSFPS